MAVTKSKVYFTKEISPETMVKMYQSLGVELPGKVAVKVHSGEQGNQNYIRAEFMRPMIEYVHGRVVECNTAYDGERNTTAKHLKLLKKHAWSEYFDVDLMDADGEMELPVSGGKHLAVNYVGKNLANYDSMLVLSHFKGHPMGGYGGALKNLSIGVASSHGKAVIHGAGKPDEIWSADHDSFLESMADADKSVMDHFGQNILFINVMTRMSVDCDCCAVAEDPKMADIGTLASTDPVALDRACLDLVYASADPGKKYLIERIESRNGAHTVDAAAALGVGLKEYELIDLDC